MQELENIDDECDAHNIDFVKISDAGIAASFKLAAVPTLVYFRKGTASVFDGDLVDEDTALAWILATKEAAGDVIEDVDSATFDKLLEGSVSVVAYFCKLDLIRRCVHSNEQMSTLVCR